MPPRDPDVRVSRLMAFALRHGPNELGLSLDEQGWTPVDDLVRALRARGLPVGPDDVARIVATSDKQRFALSPDGRRIRANQGHSIPVDLALEPREPPPLLFHGTVARFLDGIRATGLERGARHHVHLSATREAAEVVARRRGPPVILEIAASRMVADGHTFFLSDNGVWLTLHVLPRYIQFP